jgi:hypothetical protein
MEGIQVGTDCFDWLERLGCSSAGLEDRIFCSFRWARSAMGDFGSHLCKGMKTLVSRYGFGRDGRQRGF